MRHFFSYHTSGDRACIGIELDDFEPLAEFTRAPVDGLENFVASLPIKVRYRRKGFNDFVPFDPLIGIFSKRSLECFEEQVQNGELDVVDLGFRGLSGFYAFNVRRTVEVTADDVLSEPHSNLADITFFRSSLLPWSPIFVTRKFISQVSEHRLAGCALGLPDAPFKGLTLKQWNGTVEDASRFH